MNERNVNCDCRSLGLNSSVARRAFLMGLAVTVGSASGCSMFSDGTKKDSKWSWFKKKEYQEPKSLVAIWTEDKLVMPGKPMTRGFGGRIYFYNDRSQAIPVDGELVIYGFDESARRNASLVRQEADRKFRFTPEQFTEHFSQSELGASYSIWLPWDTVGEQGREVTLFPTFITKSGQMIRGESAKVLLTGPTPQAAPTPQLQVQNPQYNQPSILGQNPAVNQVQTASATMPTNSVGSLPTFEQGNIAADAKRRSTTIEIPQSSSIFGRK